MEGEKVGSEDHLPSHQLQCSDVVFFNFPFLISMLRRILTWLLKSQVFESTFWINLRSFCIQSTQRKIKSRFTSQRFVVGKRFVEMSRGGSGWYVQVRDMQEITWTEHRHPHQTTKLFAEIEERKWASERTTYTTRGNWAKSILGGQTGNIINTKS